MKWYENTDSKYSPFFDADHDMWVIKNEKADVYSFAVTKQWEVGEGEEPPVNEVQVQLYRMAAAAEPSAEDIIKNGQAVGGPVTLTKDGNWTYTWDNLPKKTGTQNYYYAVKELTTVFGFAPEYDNPATSGDVITQTITNKPTDIQPGNIMVRKQWQDDNGNPIDPPEGASATMQLYQQKGEKTAVAGGTLVPVTMILKDNGGTEIGRQTYDVQSGTAIGYTVKFWQEVTWDGAITTSIPEGATATKSVPNVEFSSEGGGWRSWDQITVSGTVENVTGPITLTIQSRKPIYNSSSVTSGSNTVEAPQFSANYTSQTYETVWETTWTPYGSGKILSAQNNWSDYWMNLPLEETKDGITYYYRYTLKETSCSEHTQGIIYTFNGVSVEDPAKLNDFDGGTVIVTNQVLQILPELPEAGGIGTHLYTLGGLLLMAVAGILMYSHGKRRKEDFASS